MSLTILCGMPEEAAIAKAVFAGVQVLSGADKLDLPALVPATCTRIVSFGLCGGLAPGLGIGAIAVASRVADQAGTISLPDQTWSWRVAVAASATLCPWYSSGVMDQADSSAQRSELLGKYGAWAIDDESRYAAALAQTRKIPFAVFRSVSDDAGETLPLAATGAIMNKNGTANIDYLLRAIAAEPLYQTIDLFEIAADFNASLCTLQAAAAAARAAFLD